MGLYPKLLDRQCTHTVAGILDYHDCSILEQLLASCDYTNRRAKVHKKQQLITPSFRFPLQAGGTHAPHAVPLAKRGEPEGGGQL